MSNTVEYCRILCILGHFWAIFTCFLHYSTLTNKNTNNYSFWFDFYDLNQIIIRFDSSVFDIIRLFIANHVELFASFRFVSLRFTIRITSFLTRFDSSQDTVSMYSFRAQIESQKPLFAQAYIIYSTTQLYKPHCNLLQYQLTSLTYGGVRALIGNRPR